MTSQGSAVVLLAVLALTVAAAVVLATPGANAPGSPAASEEFQRLIGGLGFGPALDLATCSTSFDPRLCRRCSQDLGPIPGGYYFCPQHAESVFYYPPLEPNARIP